MDNLIAVLCIVSVFLLVIPPADNNNDAGMATCIAQPNMEYVDGDCLRNTGD